MKDNRNPIGMICIEDEWQSRLSKQLERISFFKIKCGFLDCLKHGTPRQWLKRINCQRTFSTNQADNYASTKIIESHVDSRYIQSPSKHKKSIIGIYFLVATEIVLYKIRLFIEDHKSWRLANWSERPES